MATLIRTRAAINIQDELEERRPLHLDIPTPFPRLPHQTEGQRYGTPSVQVNGVGIQKKSGEDEETVEKGEIATVSATQAAEGSQTTGALTSEDTDSDEFASSILSVQKSCFTTLNDLLSTSTNWRPIIPDRRHSMPSPRTPLNLSSPPSFLASTSSTPVASTPLQTLVLNLRAQETENMTECHASDLNDVPALVHELQTRVDRLASARLTPHDASLARSLVSLVSQFHRLAELHPPPTRPATLPRTQSWGTSPVNVTTSPTTVNPLTHLQRQLSDLQLERDARETEEGSSSRPPVQAVETALLWTRVDQEFDRILSLCSDQPSSAELETFAEHDETLDHLPPEYEVGEYRDPFGSDAELPLYDAGGYEEFAEKAGEKTREREREREPSGTGGISEKMRMDLEAVALAIDRLYVVAPQLHDQRVELKKSKREQMERARLAGPSKDKGKDGEKESQRDKVRVRPGKERAREEDESELEKMVELLGKASQRKLVDQSVVLDGGMQAKLAQARQRDQEKREAFVTRLARHSDAGRLHSQEAVLAKKRTKDPDAMLSLPEFILEGVPEGMQLKMQMEDPKALLSLPEFVREPVPTRFSPQPTPPPAISRRRSFRGLRSRSMSAPPLAWLLNTASRSTSPIPEGSENEKERDKEKEKEPRRTKLGRTKRPGSSSGIPSPPPWQAGLDVHYVAEYHENLQHILVFLNVQGMIPGANLEAEVVPVSGSSSVDERSRLMLKCGATTSPLLSLPAPVPPGLKEVRVIGQYYEVKLPVTAPSPSPFDAPTTLMDATQLSSTAPTSFVCASCSLPLVHASRLREYRDLPSEHWAELVDAWMCHTDQRLHDHVKKHSVQGFWPQEGEALVGGSYILFEESAVVTGNFWPADEQDDRHDDGWRRTRCICGAIIGRCQERPSSDGNGALVYRLAKYAVRPVSGNSEPPRLPLSAFIAEDMNEFVHAHATYRFVIFDEEEERPRILVWLFKPMMRLSYIVPTQYVIPKSASVRAAKVLFKILDAASAYADLEGLLNRYPGFPQAEHLYYPRGICRRLGALLKESNSAYPENMRTMTGLDVGWLQRA
ncbi:HECT-like ubiquitin-conjugating enzyme-binding-domain-containing protein [Fomes fomentarius]|nr:HECT-like ubiquitin-conjugating enzyme-binding-domain-containing protein [Fomes fomentarius]